MKSLLFFETMAFSTLLLATAVKEDQIAVVVMMVVLALLPSRYGPGT